VSDDRNGIPFFNRIPVLGYLFGNTTKVNNRTELIILLTPRVIRNQTEAQNVTSGYVDTITNTGKGKITQEELLRGQKIVPDQGPSINNTNK
jgi:type II secretory pathway component GspD/PulD (secretin)